MQIVKSTLLSSAVIAAGVVSTASAAPSEYFNDFSTVGFAHQSANWSLSSGKLVNAASGSTAVVSSATMQMAGLGSGSYSISTQFTIVDNQATFGINQNASVGLALFAGNPELAGASAKYLLADVSAWANGTPVNGNPGLVRLFEIGSTSTNLALGDSGLGALAAGATYTIKAIISESTGGAFQVSVGLFDEAGLTQFGNSATANFTPGSEPTGGFYTGVRSRYPFGAAGQDARTDFDNYSVVVPEPASLALTGLAGLVLMRRRR